MIPINSFTRMVRTMELVLLFTLFTIIGEFLLAIFIRYEHSTGLQLLAVSCSVFISLLVSSIYLSKPRGI